MPEHPGNSRNDDSLAGTIENLVNRPRHVSLAIDAVAASPHFRSSVSDAAFSMIGHSMGGYTALAVAGGRPSESPGEPVLVERDDRVTHVVLLAPATPWFQGESALTSVDVPILMFSGAEDKITPLWHAEVVLNGVPMSTTVDHRIVENAGHFSFMSPFPESMRNPDFAPSLDPAGFDREFFQGELAVEILRFFESH
jgi:predicted dienelactone hydrolase